MYPHIEKHFTAGDTVRDVVIGMSDGLTVPFALAAGLTGAIHRCPYSPECLANQCDWGTSSGCGFWYRALDRVNLARLNGWFDLEIETGILWECSPLPD